MSVLERIDDYLDDYLAEAKAKVTVYDNGGKTVDRYTVIINGEGFVMSGNADSHQGINQYIGTAGSDFKVDKDLGKKITKYPKGVSKAIQDRMKEE